MPRQDDEPRRLILLGSTGSIGTNVLRVIDHLHANTSHRFEVAGLAAGANAERLAEQARRYDVRSLALASESRARAVGVDAFDHVGEGAALALIDAIAQPGDLVVGAMVGSAGLPAIFRAIERGCDVALANKETLVAAGALVMPLVKERNVRLLPVDSEHSAIFQCLLAGRDLDEVRRVVLTASGGPFRDASPEALDSVSVEDALNHPTWNMGAKVTIDSATLMNKALEVIEAHWLFGLDAERIDAIIHPQSIVHSFVEFVDGSVFAQLSPPDMKSPIQYALTWPHRAPGCATGLDWSRFEGLRFQRIDAERFPAIELARDVIRTGGTAGASFNAANEVAVRAFLREEISFPRIVALVTEVLDQVEVRRVESLEDVYAADADARACARRLLGTGHDVGVA